MISYRKYNHSTDYDAYRKFAETNWGKGCHQSSHSFLSWLNSNPNHSINLAIKKNHVYGCFHEFEAPIIYNNKIKFFYTLHDLMVNKDKVSQLGLKLMQDSILQDSPVILSGAVGRISRAYMRLGSHQFKSHWYRKFIIPRFPMRFSFRNQKILNNIQNSSEFIFINNKNKKYFSKIQLMLNNYNYADNDRKLSEFFKWRFFHKDSPLTFFVSDKEYRNTVMFSLGLKKFIPFLRIFSINDSDQNIIIDMLKSIENFASKFGIPVMLYAVTENIPPPASLGFKPYKEMPKSYIYSKKEKDFKGVVINGFSTDIGFNNISFK